jgi:hypothetical protein
VRIPTRTTSLLRKKAKRGHRGYPVASVVFYGPTDQRASKVAVGIIHDEGEEPAALERWFVEQEDIRQDQSVEQEILSLLETHGVRSVAMSDGILGCPHEEGVDYPEGSSCPKCPYWAGRDRFTKERVQ